MLPIAGGNWNNGAGAGVFALNLTNASTNNNNNNGARAQRLQFITPNADAYGFQTCRIEGRDSVLGLLALNKRGRRFQ